MGPVVRRLPREMHIPGSPSAVPGGIIPVTYTLVDVLWWLPSQVSSVIGSALGLVDPPSVFYEQAK